MNWCIIFRWRSMKILRLGSHFQGSFYH